MTHLDLRAATAKQVHQLRFVQFEEWFPPRRDERASEGFYTPLKEDFYNAYLNSGVAFRSHRVCSIEAIVTAAREQIYLDGLADMYHHGSVSSMLQSGLTHSTDSFTLHSEAVTTGSRALGSERF